MDFSAVEFVVTWSTDFYVCCTVHNSIIVCGQIKCTFVKLDLILFFTISSTCTCFEPIHVDIYYTIPVLVTAVFLMRNPVV